MDEEKAIITSSLALSKVTRTDSVFNVDQVNKMFQATPEKYIKSRPAKGGGTWDYVDTAYVRRVLDSMFGFNWDFEIETSLKEAFDVAVATKVCVVKGILTARVRSGDEWVTIRKSQFGRKEIAFKTEWSDELKKKAPTKELLDFGNDMKAATSDALKKCASQLGVASDVYSKEDFVEYTVYDDNSQTVEDIKEKVASLKESKEFIDYLNSLSTTDKVIASPIVDARLAELNAEKKA